LKIRNFWEFIMPERYLTGIDIGTSGAKASIFDLKGKVVGSASKGYRCEYPRPNWVEQDAHHIVSSGMRAAGEALAQSGIRAREVAAISFSTQRCCTICIDNKGELLRPLISWQDNRTAKEVKEILQKIPSDRYYDITCMPLNTTWMISKILWLRKHEPKVWDKLFKIVQLQDFTLNAWGVEGYYDDFSDAGFYGLWDPYALDWNEEILDMFDIDKTILPKPTPSGTKVGAVSKAVSEKTGFMEGTPLCVGAGDQNCAAVGAGVVEDGLLSVSLGTAGATVVYLNKPFRDPQRMAMVTNHADQGRWQLEGYQAAAGSVYRWFKNELTGLEASAKGSGKDVYRILDEWIAKTPAGAKGLVFLPYLASAGTPRWNSEARGVLAGLTLSHDRGCVARSFMEGISMEVRDMIETFHRAGITIDHVRIMGGATKSPVWNQLQADIYNRPVQTLKTSDAAVLGAAVCGGVGIGIFKDFQEGVSAMVSIEREYGPQAENVKRYNDLYQAYCLAYEGMDEKGVFHAIAQMQEKV
jgi:sugar (pentulose or hexulose) kinase